MTQKKNTLKIYNLCSAQKNVVPFALKQIFNNNIVGFCFPLVSLRALIVWGTILAGLKANY